MCAYNFEDKESSLAKLYRLMCC